MEIFTLLLAVLTMIVIICLIGGYNSGESFRLFPILTSLFGLNWFWISLMIMLLMVHSNNVKEGRDVEQSQQVDLLNSSAPPASVPVPPIASGDVEESIYENETELFQKTQL